ncbi:MAG: sulfatase [Planctomycetota bacterium]|nr:sulfatase [Planctomycetota bacterium]
MRLLATILVGLVGILPGGGCGSGSDEPVDVVLVVVDTLRADHLGCYGYERDTSPAIDAFAREGVLFERALAQSTWTKPTVASLMTGLFPSRHGVHHEFSTLDDSFVTLAEHLRAAGYRTGAFGQNHLVFGPTTGFDQGFERFQPVGAGREDAAETPRAEDVVDDALAWLEELSRDGGGPFLLYVHLFDPHGPYDPPSPYSERFDRGYDGSVDGYVWAHGGPDRLHELTSADWDHLRDLYDGEIAYTDAQIARLFESLEQRSGRETLIILVADHGEEFYEHRGYSHGPTMMEEIVRVPLICRFPDWPERMRGLRHAGLVQQIDVLPTVLDVVGLAPPAKLPGRSLREQALDPASSAPFGLSEINRRGHYRKAVVSDNFKYVRTWTPYKGEALFDLAADPGEHTDVAGEHPDLVRLLRRVLEMHVSAASGGYSLVVQNDGDAQIEVTGWILTRAPLKGIDPLYSEEENWGAEDWDGPLDLKAMEYEGEEHQAARIVLRTAPGDRDGILFVPAAEEERVFFFLAVDGKEAPPERVFLGAEGRHPDAMPFELPLDADDLAAAPPARDGGEGAYRIWIWRNLDVVARRVRPDAEILAELEALGYLGED